MGRRGWGGQRQRERNLIVRWVQPSMTAAAECAWERETEAAGCSPRRRFDSLDSYVCGVKTLDPREVKLPISATTPSSLRSSLRSPSTPMELLPSPNTMPVPLCMPSCSEILKIFGFKYALPVFSYVFQKS